MTALKVIDSSGWIEFFTGGPNRFHFREAIFDTENLIVPVITIYEVYRKISQHDSEDATNAVLAMQQGRVIELSAELALYTAQLAAMHRLPMADSLIYATARSVNAELLTQDAHFETLPGVKFFPK